MRRRSIVPFFIGSKRITSLRELKEILSKEPHSLLIPLKDGRLAKFLKGISSSYVECLDANNPEESLKQLAEKLGVKIEDKLSVESVSVVSSPEQVLELIKKGEKEIELPSGEIFFEELILDRPVRLIGQGKNTTILKCNTLKICSDNIIFKNIGIDVNNFLPQKKPQLIDSLLSFKSSVSPNLDLAVGIDRNLNPKRIVVEISKPISFKNVSIYYENIDFVFKENGSISFENCKCNFLNCSFKRDEKFDEAPTIALSNCNTLVERCSFSETATLSATENSKLRIVDSKFTRNNISLSVSGTSEIDIRNCEFIENERGVSVLNKGKLKVTDSKFIKHKKPDSRGTGIVGFDSSQLEIHNCEFTENERGISTQGNAKLKVLGSKFIKHKSPNGVGTGIVGIDSSQLEVDNCEFIENERSIRVWNNAKLKIINSKFIKYKNTDDKGTGIIGFHSSQLEVDNCEFIKNKRGIEVQGNAKLKVTGSKFIKHKSPDSMGTGIVGFDSSQLEIHNCEFTENERGISTQGNAKLKVLGSKFTKHKNPNGRGAGVFGARSSQLEIYNCEFTENERGISTQGNAKLKVLGSKFIKHKSPNENEIGVGVFGARSSQLEIYNCEFIENEGGIQVQENAKLKISLCNLDRLYCFSPYVGVTNSKIEIIIYDGESKKPVVRNSKVGKWKDIGTGGCYITTAVCLSLGKEDNCYELNTFRWFRDKWLARQPDGLELIERYYKTAPLIVESINRRKNSNEIYLLIWKNYLSSCLNLIERGSYKRAKNLYIKMVNELKKQFLTEENKT
jgi:hypothetical protein